MANKYKTITGGSLPASKYRSAGDCGTPEPCATGSSVCEVPKAVSKPTPVINVTNVTQNITQTVSNQFVLQKTLIQQFKHKVVSQTPVLTFPQIAGMDLIMAAVDGLVLYDVAAAPTANDLLYDKSLGSISLGFGDFYPNTVIKLVLQSDQIFGSTPFVGIVNTVSATLAANGTVIIPKERMIDMIHVVPVNATPALNIGTTPAGSELAGPESIDAGSGLIISSAKYTGTNDLTLYFTGITGVTSVKIYLKHENIVVSPPAP